jgi:hypothetical protein
VETTPVRKVIKKPYRKKRLHEKKNETNLFCLLLLFFNHCSNYPGIVLLNHEKKIALRWHLVSDRVASNNTVREGSAKQVGH